MPLPDPRKRWLLPALVAALAGAAWLNLAIRSGTSTRRATASAPGPGGRVATASAPMAGEPAAAPETDGLDDLQALAAPPPSANDPAPLLRLGRRPLALAPDPKPVIALHPEGWGRLYRPPGPPAPAPPGVSGPLPVVDFLFRAGARQEAWVAGRGYAPGADLGGGYVLKRITPTGVVLASPRGEVTLPLASGARPDPTGTAGRSKPQEGARP
jgi:hypothetical protein